VRAGGFATLTVIGSNGDDVIDLGGITGVNVFIAAKAGDDVLLGGNGDDILSGGDGDDILIDNVGADQLFGGAGDDVLLGGPGAKLSGGPGSNVLIGGTPFTDDPPLDPAPLQRVPEPATMLLLATGAAAIATRRRRCA
jgi:Ca2+-binding RTX toxin-like protein